MSADRSKIAVVGAGSWGTTVANLLAGNGHAVQLWALESEVVDGVNRRNENPLFHPGIALHPELRATGQIDEAVGGVELVVMAVPTQFMRQVATDLRGPLAADVPLVSLSKGIENETLFRPSQIITEVLDGRNPVGVLSGPNLAKEIITGHPASTVLAFDDIDLAHRMQPLFSGPRFDVYTNHDVIGCELGGSIKNVIAVAAGMAAGLDHGQNSIAALLCRGLVEMASLGTALGANPETFLGLAGQGDLVATCLSKDSRNHHFGRELARGRTVAEITASTNMVAEGVKSVDNLLALAKRAGVDTPLMNLVHYVVNGLASPAEAFERGRPTQSTHELHELIVSAAQRQTSNGDPR